MGLPGRSDSLRSVNAPSRTRLRVAYLMVMTAGLSGCGIRGGGGPEEGRNNILGYDSGAAPKGEGLGGLEAVLLFGVVPLALMLVVAALVWLPGMVRGNRYRPARGWSAAPLWFGGPPDPAAAVESAQVGQVTRGGASGSW